MANLFSDDFPEVESQKELDGVIKAYPKYDRYYVVSGCIKERKEKFNNLWEYYKPYCDSYFLSQVKLDFHSRTWEMYLGNVFLKNELKISPSNNGPDIKIISFSPPIWIEAVVAKKGEGPDAVPETVYEVVTDVPHDEMILRLTNSLEVKFQKYKEYLSKGIIGEHDPFAIAVNRGALEHPDPDIPLIFKCLFALGYLTIPISQNRKRGKPFFSKRDGITKKDGSPVSLSFFENIEHNGISGIIYSPKDVLNHPDKIGEDCIFVHNYNAKNKIDKELFKFLVQYKKIENQIKII